MGEENSQLFTFLSPIAFGTMGGAFCGQLLGHFGLIGPDYRYVFIGLLFLGVLLGSYFPPLPSRSSQRAEKHERSDILARISAVILFIFITLRIIKSGIIRGNTDALSYHLVAPQLWWEHGSVYFQLSLQETLSASYWEYLLLWGKALYPDQSTFGLIQFQFFGQWAHSFLGVGGAALALRGLLRSKVDKSQKRWLDLAVIAGLSSYSLGQFAWVAKNDWAVAMWLLTGTWILFSVKTPEEYTSQDSRKLLAAGLLLGTGLAAKFTSAFFIFGVGITWLVTQIKPQAVPVFKTKANTKLRIFYITILALLPIISILLRNYLVCGNPTYPIVTQFFGNPWESPSYSHQAISNQGILSFGLSQVSGKLNTLFRESPWAWTFCFVPFAFLFSKNYRKLYLFWLITLIGIAGFVFHDFGFSAFIRWIGVPLFLFNSLNFLALTYLIEEICSFYKFSPATRYIQQSTWCALVIFILNQNFPRTLASEFRNYQSPTQDIDNPDRLFFGGDSKHWLRENANQGELIFSTADNETYYISNLRYSNLILNPYLDSQLYFIEDPAKIIRELRNLGGRYLLDTNHWESHFKSHLVFWGPYSERLSPLLISYPNAIRFWGKDSWVIDLEILDDELNNYCSLAQEFPQPFSVEKSSYRGNAL